LQSAPYRWARSLGRWWYRTWCVAKAERVPGLAPSQIRDLVDNRFDPVPASVRSLRLPGQHASPARGVGAPSQPRAIAMPNEGPSGLRSSPRLPGASSGLARIGSLWDVVRGK
jgi:hypothetical protein